MGSKILTERQESVLKLIGAHKEITAFFYLSGGTTLAGFYLFHRYSEDLDFFSESEFDVRGISAFFSSVKNKLGFYSIDFQQSLNRNLFFLKFSDETLKMEFTYYPFTRIEQGVTQDGISVDSLLDIAVNKLFTIYQRSTARDYIDLYCICKKEGWVIADLIKKVRVKFDWHIDPLQLGTQFLKAENVQGLPRMIDDIPEESWRDFFKKEALQLKGDVLE